MIEPDNPQPKPTADSWGLSRARAITLLVVFLSAVLVLVAVCKVPDQAHKFQPTLPPPVTQVIVEVTEVAVTEVAATGTPLPTWTPVPTPTPQPLVDLPNQQRAYQEYRIFHLLFEYRVCYRHHVQAPPTAIPPPTAGPTIVYRGQNPDEPWRDDPRFMHLKPTPTLTPTPIPGAIVKHLPAPYGLSDREVDDHALRDLGGATRWLIERYSRGDCTESTHYAAFEGRTVFLNDYSRR